MFTLVVMAAGLGSRFGGTKQLAPVGAHGEAFLDFAITDARAAGADRVVLIVRSDIEDDVNRHFEGRGGPPADLDVIFVRQDTHGPPRPKPWGTAHAVLSASAAVRGPFVVCNADDYYGPTAYTALARAMKEMAGNEARLCGYRLDRTLPAEGSVTRGVCRVDGDRLTGIFEQEGISRAGNDFPAGTLVSMNLWGFPPAFMNSLRDGFARFLENNRHSPTAEYLLPHAVAAQMEAGTLTVRVVPTDESWIGVTNPEDLETARRTLAHRR
ncbi:nucleotidyltransferase family protein [Candidatus Poriferisocius sp.]|uniref:nucleotidyltransferase family protein n=1 Tax=Candidatus Poriferisocius sp. TaxID=3101276 RepID=UPI003B019013